MWESLFSCVVVVELKELWAKTGRGLDVALSARELIRVYFKMGEEEVERMMRAVKEAGKEILWIWDGLDEVKSSLLPFVLFCLFVLSVVSGGNELSGVTSIGFCVLVFSFFHV